MARAASRQAGALRSERRPITTLFCDLVDSVGLATRLDPEDLMQVLDRYKDFCDDIVTDHGGYLAQFLGDGVLAYFGYPQADEDDAANAVRAGLAILGAVAQLDGGSGSPVQVRVGIASGPVVIGDRVSRANNRTAEIVGRVPNLAARLQAAARPGSVVIADETRRVTRGLFAYQDLGALTLKGFASPVQGWEVVQTNAAASRYRARLQDAALPFVGRKHELELLQQRWAKARSGDGQVVYVIGEAGIGKSRLTEMFRQQVATEPHLLVHFYCSPQHSDSTLYPIIDSLARLAGFERQDTAAVRITKLRRMLNLSDEADEIALAAIAGLLSLPLEGPSPLAEQTPEKRREVTIAALTDQFVRFSAAQPFVVIVEDLQWVDATTLELLQNIVQQTTRSQILLILTARPEFRPPWADTDATRTLKLERLDATSSVELCRHAADNTLSDALLRQIVERSDGIPLYVEELTRTVVESLESAGIENSGSTGTGDAALIPLSLHDSLVARLDRLGAARQVANIGAVIGRKFNGDLLNAVASQLGVELRSSVRQLVRSGLVSQSGPPASRSYLFHHALIRDAAYDSLLRSDRQVLHGVIGTVLREKFPDTADTEPEIVAHHFSRSTTPLEAIVYWEKAGQRATSRAAHRDAAVHYSAALELAKTQEDSIERKQRELSLLIPLAISLSSSRGYAIDEVRDALTEARQICDLFGNVSALYPVLRGLCTFHITRNDLDIAEDLAGRCILIAKNADSIPYLIEAENALGYVLFGRGELERARHHLQAAVDLYEKNEHLSLVFPTEQDPKMTCAGLLSLTLHMQGDAVGAAAKADQSVAWARKLNRPFDLAYALVFASQYYTLSHDYAKAKDLAEESMAISQRHGFGLWYLCAHLELGCALARLGQTEEAISILEPGLARYAAIGCKFNSSFTMGELAACYAAAGRLEQARGTIDAAINRPDNQGDLAYLSFLHRIRADIMAKAPDADLDEVTRELQTAVSVARSQGAAMLESEAMARLKDILPNQVLTG